MAIANILVPLDGSPFSTRILAHVDLLRRGQPDVAVTLLHVVEEEAARADGDSLLERAQAGLARRRTAWAGAGSEATGRVTCLVRRGDDPARVILDVVGERAPDLVAMATHGRSAVVRWVRGSVAERLLRRCPAPVLYANAEGFDEAQRGYRRVLVCLDGSEDAARVLPLARDLAAAHEAKVELLHVADDPLGGEHPEVPQATRACLEAQRKAVSWPTPPRIVIVGGDVASAIVDASDDGQTLLVLTTHGRTGLDHWLFGSVAEAVLRHARCPLLVQRVASFSPR